MTVADSYLSTQVLTASPYRLHLMVVEGAIQFGSLGASALENGEVETAHLALSKSRDFVTELLGGLNEEYDPQLAARMKQLFFFAYVNLVEGESERDPKKVRDALLVLTRHHETWLELAAHLKPSAPGADSSQSGSPAPQRAWSA
jgi:flagellar protein FliS